MNVGSASQKLLTSFFDPLHKCPSQMSHTARSTALRLSKHGSVGKNLKSARYYRATKSKSFIPFLGPNRAQLRIVLRLPYSVVVFVLLGEN